jgi:ribosome-associated translation inhibitor RaiA
MQLPIEIRFRDMGTSPFMDGVIREQAAHLERFFDHIISCRVLVEQQHLHHRHGRQFHVRIELAIPGERIVVSHDAGRGEQHEKARIAVHGAFAALERRLEASVRKLRVGQQSHHDPLRGKDARLVLDEALGSIEMADLQGKDATAKAS